MFIGGNDNFYNIKFEPESAENKKMDNYKQDIHQIDAKYSDQQQVPFV